MVSGATSLNAAYKTALSVVARATGYSARTLKKAESVIDAAADESQPEPVDRGLLQVPEGRRYLGCGVFVLRRSH